MKKFMCGFLIATMLTICLPFAFAEDNSDSFLSKIYQNVSGDLLKVFDKESRLVAKLGTARGDGGNIGGTLILTNNDESKPRVALGIRTITDSGVAQLMDKNSRVRVYLSGEQQDEESGLFLFGSDGTIKSMIRETYGTINNEQIATRDWTLQEIEKLKAEIAELKSAINK